MVEAYISEPLPATHVAFRGQPYSIRCMAVGSPPPEFQWSKDNVDISNGSEYNLSDPGQLLINSVDVGGTFKCNIRNVLLNGDVVGEDFGETELEVIGELFFF